MTRSARALALDLDLDAARARALAEPCAKCGAVVERDGVRWKRQRWHRECLPAETRREFDEVFGEPARCDKCSLPLADHEPDCAAALFRRMEDR